MNTYLLDALQQRRSTPAKQLGEPAPSPEILMSMLEAAVRVPDHGKLVPFRFLQIEGDARLALGEFLAQRSQEKNGTDANIEKDRMRFSYAPVIITVIGCFQHENKKVPVYEQRLTAGCVCFALLQAAQAYHFGAQWLTAWMAYDEAVKRYLNITEEEEIVGFIHIGTPKLDAPERDRPNPRDLLTTWQPNK